MVAVTENGKMVARKRTVEVGQLYNDKIEIKTGVQSGEQLITEGFQGLYDGQLLALAD
jgi:multidrug efflux pump subunit AcrA (membrane-fusion protein)